MVNRLIVPYPPPSRPGRSGAIAEIAPVPGQPSPDNAAERLIKYIPSEVISTYVLLLGLIDAAAQTSPLRLPAAWGVFLLGLIMTPIYLIGVYKPRGAQWWHPVLSTVSFAAWAYALGGPFRMGRPWIEGYPYESWFAALVAGAVSWVIALVWKPQEPAVAIAEPASNTSPPAPDG
jgi:hypothetical protein